MHTVNTAPPSPEALQRALRLSAYPAESDDVLTAILDYCAVLGVDPMTRPVRAFLDDAGRIAIRPTLTLYRVRALATGQFAGKSEPVFTRGAEGDFDHPASCSITIWRVLSDGSRAETTVREGWDENVWRLSSGAIHPLWAKRPYGQLARITEAQAYRAAFGDVCPGYTWEELDTSETEPMPVASSAPASAPAPVAVPDFRAKPKAAPAGEPVAPAVACLTPTMIDGLRARLGERDEADFCAALGLPAGSFLHHIPVAMFGAALAKATH